MDPTILVAIIALGGTVYSTVVSRKMQNKLREDARQVREDEQQIKAEEILARFRDPLMYAAYDLQSRLFNILKLDFVSTYYH